MVSSPGTVSFILHRRISAGCSRSSESTPRSSAALLFTSGPRHGEAIGTFHGEPLYHGSLAAAEYRRLLNNNGFDVIANVAEDPDCGGHTVWLARMR